MCLKNNALKPISKLYKMAGKAFSYSISMILCCYIFPAQAADWASISNTKQEQILVDMDSYNASAGIPYITSKIRFFTPQNYRKNAIKFSYSESLSITQFNCAQHRFKKEFTRFFDANNKLIGSEKGDQSFKPIVAGSKDAMLESLVCQVHQMVGGN